MMIVDSTEFDRTKQGFWSKYNQDVLKRIQRLLAEENKSSFRVDMHIHSRYSSDGYDTVEEKIRRAKAYGFDIISITDHDSVSSYKDVYSLLYCGCTEELPIIVTGIEHSLYCEDYSGLCHILQYFINVEEQNLLNEITLSQKAYWNRANLQFERISQNPVLAVYAQRFGISYNIDEYRSYLKYIGAMLPEYSTLLHYIYSKLKKRNISIRDLLDAQFTANNADPCPERRKLMKMALIRAAEKLKTGGESEGLLGMIFSPVGIDDCFFPGFPASGSLTVTDYGQIPLCNLYDEGISVLAHPVFDMERVLNKGAKIIGLEQNRCNWRTSSSLIQETVHNLNLIVTTGSDSHSIEDHLYDDIKFYDIPKSELLSLYQAALQRFNV